jgi:hypothetical protein
MVFSTIILSLIVKLWLSGLVINLYFYSYTVCTNNACAGNQGVFRFSFALAIFFATMLLLVGCMKSQAAHGGMWVLKGAYYFLLIILAFVIPNTFYNVYANIARVGACIFLLMQMFVIIDFSYKWNESWVEKADAAEKEDNLNGSRKWKGGIIACCLILLIGSIVAWGLMFKYLAAGSSCGTERFIISFTLILTTAFTLLSISGVAEYGALLPSSALTLYCTYLTFTGLKNNPSSCNTYSFGTTTSSSSDPVQIMIGLAFAAISITYSCYSMSSDTKVLFGGGGSSSAADDKVKYDDEAPAKASQADKDKNKTASSEETPEGEESEEVLNDPHVKKVNALFHFIMLVASMYFGMLLTDWASNLYDNSGQISTLGTANLWANVGCAWTIALMYTWTLIAPKACPGRDFS